MGRKASLTSKGRMSTADKARKLGGKGRLTLARIDYFQTLYGRAIRNNRGDVASMERETWAILRHYSDPADHSCCPQGPDSFCSF